MKLKEKNFRFILVALSIVTFNIVIISVLSRIFKGNFMAGQKNITIEGIGQVKLLKNKRVKKFILKLEPVSNLPVLTFPAGISYKDAAFFIIHNKTWFLEAKERLLERLQGITEYSDKKTFYTEHHKLEFIKRDSSIFTLKYSGNKAVIYCPKNTNFSDPEIQRKLRAMVDRIYKKEAAEHLPGRVENLAKKHGFSYKDIQIKSMKSRWGSCSGENVIQLNSHVVRLPENLQDYVILHELAHTVEKNHGEGFWKLLDESHPETKESDDELKDYHPSIY